MLYFQMHADTRSEIQAAYLHCCQFADAFAERWLAEIAVLNLPSSLEGLFCWLSQNPFWMQHQGLEHYRML